MKNFLVHNDEIKRDMLKFIGVSSIEDLFEQIPENARMKFLDLEPAISEMEVQ